jgi:hypothetical protein
MSHWGHITEELEASARAGRDQMEAVSRSWRYTVWVQRRDMAKLLRAI